jgi:hypothetical protein
MKFLSVKVGTQISWLMLFREIIAIYFQNLSKLTNSLRGQNAELLNVKANGAYSYRLPLEG